MRICQVLHSLHSSLITLLGFYGCARSQGLDSRIQKLIRKEKRIFLSLCSVIYFAGLAIGMLRIYIYTCKAVRLDGRIQRGFNTP